MRIFNQKNYNLLRELVITDFKLRYQGSVLGYLWSLFKPLGLFTILYIVFARFLRFGDAIPHFPAYLLLGIVLFTFFAESTTSGLQSIVDRGDTLRKVQMPKYTIVLSTVFSNAINLFINLGVVLGFALFTGVDFRIEMLLIFPLIVELMVLSIAMSFLLSALFVKFRDFSFIWELLIQIFFYATPIIYPLSIVPARFHEFILLNPLSQIVQDARYAVITAETQTLAGATSGVVQFMPYMLIVGIAVLASWYFKREAPYFAENL